MQHKQKIIISKGFNCQSNLLQHSSWDYTDRCTQAWHVLWCQYDSEALGSVNVSLGKNNFPDPTMVIYHIIAHVVGKRLYTELWWRKGHVYHNGAKRITLKETEASIMTTEFHDVLNILVQVFGSSHFIGCQWSHKGCSQKKRPASVVQQPICLSDVLPGSS